MLNGSQNLKCPTCVPRVIRPNSSNNTLIGLSSLGEKLAELSKEKYELGSCNLSQDDPQLADRLFFIDDVIDFFFSGALRALNCEDIPSSVRGDFAAYVEATALLFAELFLQKAYNPLYPLGEQGDESGSLYASGTLLVLFQENAYQYQLQALGSTCDVSSQPETQSQLRASKILNKTAQ